MAEEQSTAGKALNLLGLGVPDTDTPAGSAIVASIISGLIVGAILWAWRGPALAVFIFLLALAQGIFREIARARAARIEAKAKKSKKRKRR